MNEEAEQHATPHRKVILLPLNLRRLTTAFLQQLARALELPTAAGAEDIRQMIDGKIEEMGHDPMNVHVAVEPGEDGQVLILRDLDGPFLQADPEPNPQEGDLGSLETASRAESEDNIRGAVAGEGDVLVELQQSNEELQQQQQNATLEGTVGLLCREITEKRERLQSLCRAQCDLVQEHDTLIAEKDEEVARLQARVLEL